MVPTTAIRLLLASGILCLATSAASAAPKAPKGKAFSYDEGLSAFLNSKNAKGIWPKDLWAVYCFKDTRYNKDEFACDFWLGESKSRKRYTVRAPQGLHGNSHVVLASKNWEMSRENEGKGKVRYVFKSEGGPVKTSRSKAEEDIRSFLTSAMKDVAAMRANEAKFLIDVRNPNRAAPKRGAAERSFQVDRFD